MLNISSCDNLFIYQIILILRAQMIQNLIGSNFDFHHISVYKGTSCSPPFPYLHVGKTRKKVVCQRARQWPNHVMVLLIEIDV